MVGTNELSELGVQTGRKKVFHAMIGGFFPHPPSAIAITK